MTPAMPRDARLAGLLYLPVVLMGPILLLYLPGRFFVPGDAAATAANILAHETLFRWGIVMGLVTEFLFLGVVVLLHGVFRETDARLASLMAIPILLQAPLAFMGSAHEVAALAFLREPGILAAFEQGQREVLVMLLLDFDQRGVLVSEIFWGLWLLPLAMLAHRAALLPRPLAVWLFLNGVAYLVISATGLLGMGAHPVIARAATPVLFGEAVFMVWLVAGRRRAR